MARNYFTLDEAELDNILMINLFPKRRERINFSDRQVFEEMLMPEILKRNAHLDFIENLCNIHLRNKSLHQVTDDKKKYDLSFKYALLFSSPKYLKLAVLITIDSIEE